MKFIINADDFGYSHEVNLAIAEAFKRGYISNTTIMVNMPEFDEAVDLSIKYGFFDKVGLHLNFFEGEPLTTPIKNTIFYEDNGMSSQKIFHELPAIYKFSLSSKQRAAIREETFAQIEKYLSTGFTEMHIDSHGHSHTLWSVYSSIRKDIKKFGFRTMRISLNYGKRRSMPVGMYKTAYNHNVKRYFTTADYFTSASEFVYVCGNAPIPPESDHVYEIMIHPRRADETVHTSETEPDFPALMEFVKGGHLLSYRNI